ncbi:MAG TPA: N-acetyltransferase [Clostridiales bacterium]|jgi:GNAT superfamily N-acetyltransferase|nr:N-acetyltransferase [Clostridiales bacterium]
MHIEQTTYERNEAMIENYVLRNMITVDSFWEKHILESNHYVVIDKGSIIGYFSIFKKHTITSFYLDDEYIQHGKSIFEKIKHYEQVTNALVSTGDEFLISHCVDNYQRLEKQAYFSIYRKKAPEGFQRRNLELVRLRTNEDMELLKLAGDFFAEDPIEDILEEETYYRIYKVLENDQLIGFGIVETGRVIKSIASIGMYVMEEKRQQGYAKNILNHLKELVESEGLKCRSGCWYYNHNSLKSMESAGAFSKTRLLRFYF